MKTDPEVPLGKVEGSMMRPLSFAVSHSSQAEELTKSDIYENRYSKNIRQGALLTRRFVFIYAHEQHGIKADRAWR